MGNRTGCATCAQLQVCGLRRRRAFAAAPHAAGHGKWRPRASRAVRQREAILTQSADERLALWPSEISAHG
eukprot:7668584-Lingulodinium_polyedra.AAC.1